MNVPQLVSDFSSQVNRCDSTQDAISVFGDVVRELGFSVAGYNILPRRRDAKNEFVKPRVLCNPCDVSRLGWNERYLNGFYQFDPVLIRSQETTLPILWRTDTHPHIIIGSRRRPTAMQLQMYDKCLKVTGIRGGVSVPIHGPNGIFGYVVAGSTARIEPFMEAVEDWCDYIFVMAHQLHEALIQRMNIADTPELHLSPREIECLSFVAMGKSIDETARILGLSYSTVRFHLRNADRKFGSTNRYRTIAKAAYAGLLGDVH